MPSLVKLYLNAKSTIYLMSFQRPETGKISQAIYYFYDSGSYRNYLEKVKSVKSYGGGKTERYYEY